jgi:tetratricopeptide (TPR) repeat protein
MATTMQLTDPLREVRVAVREGRFREAASALGALPGLVREAPEWHLLSAMTAWRLGAYRDSRDAALEARARFRARGDADGEMRAENVAAAGAFGLGHLTAAEEEWSRARELARGLKDDLTVARCSNNLGNISLYLARHDAAHGFYRLARAGFERLGFAHGVAETWINTAIAWRDLGNFDEAAAAADSALEAAERTGSRRLLAEALSGRGAAMAALGDRVLGRMLVERGLALAREDGDRLAEADALRTLASIDHAAGRTADAERISQLALAVAEALGHPWMVAEIQRERGTLLWDAPTRRTEAAACFAAAAAAFEQLGSTPRAERMRERAKASQVRSSPLPPGSSASPSQA